MVTAQLAQGIFSGLFGSACARVGGRAGAQVGGRARIAAPEARFGFPELGRFIPPSYAAAAWSLTPAVARDLCLTGRIIDAPEALALGVVSRISAGREALDDVAGAPAAATAEIKRRILRHRDGESGRGLLAVEERALRSALLE